MHIINESLLISLVHYSVCRVLYNRMANDKWVISSVNQLDAFKSTCRYLAVCLS